MGTKERQQEGTEINASLHALKECIRYAATKRCVPSHVIRASSLTKLLQGAFSHASTAKLAVICTVAPCASDTEHSLTTLRTAAALGGRGGEVEEKEVLMGAAKPLQDHPKQWTPERVTRWLSDLDGGKFQDVAE